MCFLFCFQSTAAETKTVTDNIDFATLLSAAKMLYTPTTKGTPNRQQNKVFGYDLTNQYNPSDSTISENILYCILIHSSLGG